MKKRLLALTLLAVAGMIVTGCNGGGGSSSVAPSSSSETPVTYTVDITNKEELAAEWHLGEADRNISLACSPGVVKDVLGTELLVTSSNTDVITIINNKIAHTVGEGEADIVATYHGVTAKAHVTVLPEKGEPDPITVPSVKGFLAALPETSHDQIYLFDAYIVAYQSGKTDFSKYGNFMIADSMDAPATEQLLVYGATAKADALAFSAGTYTFTNPQDFMTNDATKNIVLGCKVRLKVDYTPYNSTPEIEGIVLDYDDPEPVDPETITIKKYEDLWLHLDEEFTLEAELGPAGAVGEVVWATDSSAVVSCDNGKVKGLALGDAEITASVKDHNEITPASCWVHVLPKEDNIKPSKVATIAEGTYKLGVEQPNVFKAQGHSFWYFNGKMSGYYLDAGYIFDYGTDVTVALKEGSQDEYILSFKDGEATKYITQIVDGTYYNVKIVDTLPEKGFKWDASRGTFYMDFDGTIKALGTSSSSAYSTTGPRTIKDLADLTKDDSFWVNLYRAPATRPVITDFDFETAEAEVVVGKTFEQKLMFYPETGDSTALAGTWASSNTEVATVDKGVVTAKAAGESEISYTVDDVTAKYNISCVIPQISPMSEVLEAAKGDTCCVIGKYMGRYGTDKNIFIENGEYGIYVYGCQEDDIKDFKVGDIVKVMGVVDFYNGLFEFTKPTFLSHTAEEDATVADPVVKVLDGTEEDGKLQGRMVSVTGTVTSEVKASEVGKNKTYKVKVGEKEVTVYAKANVHTADLALKLFKDSEVTVTGFMAAYDNSAEGKGKLSGKGLQVVVPSATASTSTTKFLVDETEGAIKVGEKFNIHAVCSSDYTIKYESSDTTLATVDESGAVTGVAVGKPNITVKLMQDETVIESKVVTMDIEKAASRGEYDFSSFPGTPEWKSAYAEHVVEDDDVKITFEAANKQAAGSMIDDVPVTKGNSITVLAKGENIFTKTQWTFKQWDTKTQTITLNVSSDGGTTWSAMTTTYSDFAIPEVTLPAGTNAIKITFSSQKNQIGIVSCKMTFAA